MADDTAGVTEPVAVAAADATALVRGATTLATGLAALAAGATALAIGVTVLVTGVGAFAALAGLEAETADAAEPAEPGSVPEPAAAVVPCGAELTVEVTAEVAEVTVLVTGLELGGGVAAALAGGDDGAGVVGGGGLLGDCGALVAAVVPCVADAAVVAAEVAADVAEATVLVTGFELGCGVVAALVAEAEGGGVVAGAGVVAGGGVLGDCGVPAAALLCVADVAFEVAAELAPDVALVAVEVAAEVAEVAADVAEVAAEVTEEVVDVTAEVSVLVTADPEEPGVASVPGAVDACACRENTSKTTRIPAASIAHCAARRAARRKAGCGIGSSPPRETGPGTTAHL